MKPSSGLTKLLASTALILLATPGLRGTEPLRLQGSATVAQALAPLVPILRDELGLDVKFSAEGGSSQAIMAVGAGVAAVAMSTRELTAEDRATWPDKRFEEARFGAQVLALLVPVDVWNAGVRALSKEQVTNIYEGTIRNWTALGGEDRPIKFYNPERGHGLWELFVTWLYGDIRRAPLGKFEVVATPQDARDAVEFNAGSMTVVPPKFADGKAAFALGITLDDGEVVQPTSEHVASGKYPITRPLILIAGDRPTGAVKKLFEFILSPRGQEVIEKAGFYSVERR